MFDWDPKKAAANQKDHRVSFDEASTAFGDPFAKTFADPDHSVTEYRFITIGESVFGRLLMVSHTERRKKIRIISARKVTRRERKLYEEKD